MSLPAPKVMTGARATFSINGVQVAFATNVGYRIAIPHAPVNVLGRYSAARHEPLGYDVTVTCGIMRFPLAGGAGNAPDGKSAVQPTVAELANSEALKIEIIDRKTQEVILLVNQARLTDRGGNMGARDLLTENWTFVGVIASDGDSGEQAEASGANDTEVSS